MDEEPRVHAGHARLQSRPLGALDGLEYQRVLRHDQVRVLRQRSSEVLELLDGEAFVADSGEKVTVFEVFLHGLDRLFLLGSGNGGSDQREAVAMAVAVAVAERDLGEGEEGVGGGTG